MLVFKIAVYRGFSRFNLKSQFFKGKLFKTQLVDYLRATGLPKGWMVVFDEKLTQNPLLATKKAIFETTEGGKILRVYLVGIAV